MHSNFILIKDMDPYKIYFDTKSETFVSVFFTLDDVLTFESQNYHTVLEYVENKRREIPY